jgi:tricorn protease
LDTNSNLYEAMRGTVDKQTALTVRSAGRASDTQDFTVVPINSELILRRNAWVEDNRRRVDEGSDGKLAYVWVPNTADQGFTYFNRYFFSQIGRQGVIVDERFNNGGFIADYIIDILRREQNGYFNNSRQPDRPMTSPANGIWGPKVMLINEMSGSGGDMLPYMFRFHDIGTLVGKRTWGGLVGIWGVPGLVDGGYITSPRSGYFDIDGEWRVENEGIEPDIEVDQWTKDTVQGRDAQLEKAIEVALEQLEGNPPQFKVQPEDPIHVPQVEQ